MSDSLLPPVNPKWMTWTGRTLTFLVAGLLTFSAVMKFTPPPLDPAKVAATAAKPDVADDAAKKGRVKAGKADEMSSVAEEFHRLGYPQNTTRPIAAVEIASAILYVIPQTAVLGAILLTGYLGGATATHVRVEDPFIGPIIIGVLAWLGIFLREPRLRALIPWRR